MNEDDDYQAGRNEDNSGEDTPDLDSEPQSALSKNIVEVVAKLWENCGHMLNIDLQSFTEAVHQISGTLMKKYTCFKKWAREHPWQLAFIIAAIVVIVAAGPITTAIMSSIGFSAGGIVAGSIAAGIQSGIGSVIAGGAFAVAQSFGATAFFGIIGGAVGAGILGPAILLSVPEVRRLFRQGCSDLWYAVKHPAHTVRMIGNVAVTGIASTLQVATYAGLGCMLVTAYGVARFRAWRNRVNKV